MQVAARVRNVEGDQTPGRAVRRRDCLPKGGRINTESVVDTEEDNSRLRYGSVEGRAERVNRRFKARLLGAMSRIKRGPNESVQLTRGRSQRPDYVLRNARDAGPHRRAQRHGTGAYGEHETSAHTLNASQGQERMLIRVAAMMQLGYTSREGQATGEPWTLKPMAEVLNQYGTM